MSIEYSARVLPARHYVQHHHRQDNEDQEAHEWPDASGRRWPRAPMQLAVLVRRFVPHSRCSSLVRPSGPFRQGALDRFAHSIICTCAGTSRSIAACCSPGFGIMREEAARLSTALLFHWNLPCNKVYYVMQLPMPIAQLDTLQSTETAAAEMMKDGEENEVQESPAVTCRPGRRRIC